jgi:cytochrome c553
MPILLLALATLLLAQQPAPPRPGPPVPAASTLDYEFFKARVQPIFLAKRPGHARSITCHESGQPRLAVLSDGATTWNEEQSRQNFAAWQRVVVPGDPNASRLLMHPLAKSAGGDPFHAGGKHFQSRDDPEFQTLVAWVQTGSRAAQSTAASGLDFEYYRSRIEPIFLKERAPNEGAGMCINCHARIATRMRLQPLPQGGSGWTMEQSRQNFEAVSRVVVPGDVLKSPLAIHPLAQAAGGDAQHTGGKFWASQDNPEWQTVSTWIKSATPGVSETATASTAPSLDYEFFKTRIQPIFLAKRPGHARCITCHENGQPRLIALPEGTSAWTDEQSRQNFAAWQRVVVAGDLSASRLAMHPLAKSAGGDPFHAGGKHWQSQNDPEFQVLAAWIRGEKAAASSRN